MNIQLSKEDIQFLFDALEHYNRHIKSLTPIDDNLIMENRRNARFKCDLLQSDLCKALENA